MSDTVTIEGQQYANPTRPLMAIWLGIQQTRDTSLTLLRLVVFSIGNGVHVQEHINRAWDASSVPGCLRPSRWRSRSASERGDAA